MIRAAGVVLFAFLLVLWPVGAVGVSVPTAVTGGGASDGAVESAARQATERTNPTGQPTPVGRVADDSDAGGYSPVIQRDGGESASTRPLVDRNDAREPLVEATTSASGEPAAGEETTVRLRLTARRGVSNLRVSLPDYPFVDGDGRSFAVGDLPAGETRTLSVTVEPTEPIAQYLRFTVRGVTADGRRVQQVFHDLAVVERSVTGTGLRVDVARPSHEAIPDTTTDPMGNHSAETASAGSGPVAASHDPRAGHVDGCFSYSDPGGSLHPGRNLTVVVKEHDSGWGMANDKTIARGDTNNNGCFDIAVGFDFKGRPADGINGEAEVYVLIKAVNPAGKAIPSPVGDVYEVRDVPNNHLLSSGERVSFSGRITPANNDQAYQAVDWALDAYRFIRDHSGYRTAPTTIIVPEPDGGFYNGVTNEIVLPSQGTGGNWNWNRGTVYHEYGHAVMDAIYGPVHNWPKRCPMVPGCPDAHNFHSQTNPGFAMVEGWAEFIEAAVRYDRGNTSPINGPTGRGMDVENNEWFNVSATGVTNNDGDRINGQDTGDMDGIETEGSVASILFDLYDSNGDDPVNATFKQVFDTVRDHDPQNVENVLSVWQYGNKEGRATIAHRYGIFFNDPHEPNGRFSTATPIGPETINGTVGSSLDYYRVTVPKQTEVTVNLEGKYSLSGVDLDMVAFDSNQSPVAQSQGSSNTETFTLPATKSTPETFYIEIRTTGGSASYELSFSGRTTTTSGEITALDPGWYVDTKIENVVGTLTTRSPRMATLENGQNISYSVQLERGERLNVSNGDGRATLRIYDREGRLLSEAEPGQNFSFVSQQTGTYYVEATATHEEAQPLSLEASTALPGNDRYEVNDGFESAAPTFPGEFDELELDRSDEDVYAIYLRQGQQLVVTAEGETIEGLLELAVAGPDQETLTTQQADGAVSTTFTAHREGIHYVRLRGIEQTAGSYSLSVNVTTPENDPGEPNNGIETARDLSPGTYDEFRIAKGDRDVFAVELADNEQLQARIGFEQGEGNLDLRLYGPSGDLVDASASDTDNESVTVEAEGGGTYYVDVRGSQGSSAEYRLELERAFGGPGPDTFEPNGFEDPARPGPGLIENLSIVNGDADAFAVELPAEGTLEVTAKFEHEDGNVNLLLFGPEARESEALPVASSLSYTDNESATVTAGDGGLYTVVAYTDDNSTAGYALDLAGDMGESGDQSTNETGVRDVPDSITPGGSATVTLQSTVQNSSVTFREVFSPAFESTSITSVTVNGNPASPVLEVADSTGIVVTLQGLSADDRVTVTYEVSTASNVQAGRNYTIEGNVTSGTTTELPTDTITVREGGSLPSVAGRYDSDRDGAIDITELGQASAAYVRGELSIMKLGSVAAVYVQS